jgi:hypothetical protein
LSSIIAAKRLKNKKIRRSIYGKQEERKVENGLPVFVEIMEGLPSAARNIVTEKVLLRSELYQQL